jgi:hypothetical protein
MPYSKRQRGYLGRDWADSNAPSHKVLAFSSIPSNSSIVRWWIGYALIVKRYEITGYGEISLTGARKSECLKTLLPSQYFE